MKYITGKDIENNINMLKLTLLPNRSKYVKKSGKYPTDMQIDKTNSAHTIIKLNGSFFERSIPSELKNFFPLNMTLFNLVIKYGTRVTDKNTIIILSNNTAICPAKGTANRNNRLHSLSLVISFLNMILSLFCVLTSTIVSFIKSPSKGLLVGFTILDCSIEKLLQKRYGEEY